MAELKGGSFVGGDFTVTGYLNVCSINNGLRQISPGTAGTWEAWKAYSSSIEASAIGLYSSQGTWRGMFYGEGANQGFLSSGNSWDLKKCINGQLYLTVSSAEQTVLHSGNYCSYAVSATYNSSLNSDSRNSRGVTRLYRRDSDSDYSLQHSYDGSRWCLQGFNGDTYHAGVRVAYADSAGSAGNATTANGANGNFYIDDDYGKTVVGVYSSYRLQGVYAMGDAYKLSADGTSPDNIYGLAWSHPNAGGQASNLSSHGLLVMQAGTTMAAISTNIWISGTYYGAGTGLTGTASSLTAGCATVAGTACNAGYATSAGSATCASYLVGGDGGFCGLLYNSLAGDLNTYNTPGIVSAEYVGSTNRPTASAGHFIQISDAGGTDVKTQWYANSAGTGFWTRVMWGNGNWTSWRYMIHDGNIGSQSVNYASSAGNADTVDSLHVHGGRNNEANKVVRTDGNGHIQAGWINTTSGDNSTTAINRIYASEDGYIRYYTPANFKSVLGLIDTGNIGTQCVAAAGKLCNGYAYTNGTDGWFRSTGTAGWYSNDYSVGVYSTESGIVRTYNGGHFHSEGHYYQAEARYMYPGYLSGQGTGRNTSYYLAGSTTWGLYSNTSLNAQGLYDAGNRVYSATSRPTTVSGYGITDAITTSNIGSQSVSYATTAGSALMVAGAGTGSTMRKDVSNTAAGACAIAAGGYLNAASGEMATVGGGTRNCASNCFTTVAGGSCNSARGICATLTGGYGNIADGSHSFIGGGNGNVASGPGSVVAGGSYNQIGSSGTRSAILGGFNNNINYCNSFILGSNLTASAADTTYVQVLSKTSGTFRISHPDPAKTETHYLQHSFVESPTRGDNIYRFSVCTCNCTAIVTLPDYYRYLNEDDSIYVTAKCHLGYGYGIINEAQTEVIIYTNSEGEYNVMVIGTRKDEDAVKGWPGLETPKIPREQL